MSHTLRLIPHALTLCASLLCAHHALAQAVATPVRDQPAFIPGPIQQPDAPASPAPSKAIAAPITPPAHITPASPAHLLGLRPGQSAEQAISAISAFSAVSAPAPFGNDAERAEALAAKFNASCGMALLGKDSRAIAHIECAARVLANLPGLDFAYGRAPYPDEKPPNPSWTPAWILLRFTADPDHDHVLESAAFCADVQHKSTSLSDPALLSLMRNAGAWRSTASERHDAPAIPQALADLCPEIPASPSELSWTQWSESFPALRIEHARALATPNASEPARLAFWASWIHP